MKEFVVILKEIVSYFNREKSIIKKILVLLIITALIAISMWTYNKLNIEENISARIENLEKLTELDINVINSRPELKREYKRIVSEIDIEYTKSDFSILLSNIIKKNTTIIEQRIKFFSGGFWLFFMSIFSIKMFNGLKQIVGGFLILVFTGSIIGLVFTFVPTFVFFPINYIGVPLIQFVIVFSIFLIYSSKNNNDKTTN